MIPHAKTIILDCIALHIDLMVLTSNFLRIHFPYIYVTHGFCIGFLYLTKKVSLNSVYEKSGFDKLRSKQLNMISHQSWSNHIIVLPIAPVWWTLSVVLIFSCLVNGNAYLSMDTGYLVHQLTHVLVWSMDHNQLHSIAIQTTVMFGCLFSLCIRGSVDEI